MFIRGIWTKLRCRNKTTILKINRPRLDQPSGTAIAEQFSRPQDLHDCYSTYSSTVVLRAATRNDNKLPGTGFLPREHDSFSAAFFLRCAPSAAYHVGEAPVRPYHIIIQVHHFDRGESCTTKFITRNSKRNKNAKGNVNILFNTKRDISRLRRGAP